MAKIYIDRECTCKCPPALECAHEATPHASRPHGAHATCTATCTAGPSPRAVDDPETPPAGPRWANSKSAVTAAAKGTRPGQKLSHVIYRAKTPYSMHEPSTYTNNEDKKSNILTRVALTTTPSPRPPFGPRRCPQQAFQNTNAS